MTSNETAPIDSAVHRTGGFRPHFMKHELCILSVSLLLLSCAHAQTTLPEKISKDQPYVNALGMKFVPVPGTSVLFCTTETTVDEWKASGLAYENPEFPQTGKHPAVNITWNDAKAWCAWISQKEGLHYRLPTDYEWSCAAGIGDKESKEGLPIKKSGKVQDVYPWGTNAPSAKAGNYACLEWKDATDSEKTLKIGGFITEYSDGILFTAEVGTFPPNPLGLHDLGGNVWELCEDMYAKWSDSRVVRGGSWMEDSQNGFLLSSYRGFQPPDKRASSNGFRCVIDLSSRP